MASVQLAKTLSDLGTNSVRELFNRTGSSEQSVFKQAQIAAIGSFYLKTGGIKGPLGLPVSNVKFTGQTAVRRFAGGQIAYQASDPKGEKQLAVRINYLGFRCLKESNWDQSTGSDEPYFLIGAVATNGSKVVRRAYSSINTNSVRTEVTDIATVGISGNRDNFTPPIVLGVAAMEHDLGSKDEAEKKVRKVLEEAEEKVDKLAQAVGPFLGIPVGNHVMPDWMRDIYIGWLPEWGVALLGLGDDEIGQNSKLLFDYNPEITQWQAPAIIGKHGDNDYNFVLPVDGGKEGKYELFFLIDLFTLSQEIQPRA
ncbi:MAG: hypothetical protein IGS48_14410 [Oscillatoriales cyanobacterium C42_A2020_001]|nr:hypothetical protein [Leptolyngbyaceae cyanobacterium C42_A2020_001]